MEGKSLEECIVLCANVNVFSKTLESDVYHAVTKLDYEDFQGLLHEMSFEDSSKRWNEFQLVIHWRIFVNAHR
jgi:hypothetical protein